MKKTGLTEYAQIAEIVAALCVVISLAWVAIELRMNTNEVRNSNAMELINMATQNQMMLASSDISELFWKASINEELTPAEAARLNLLFNGLIQEVESAHYQFEQGRLDSQIAAAWDVRLLGILSSTVGQNYWQQSKILYTERFQQHVERLISQVDSQNSK